MQSTPKRTKARPSIGEPCRVSQRVRAQSPGASSVESFGENLSTASPRHRVRTASPGRRTGSCIGVGMRQSMAGGRNYNFNRNSRDPRPVGDRGFATQCSRNVVELLAARGYGKMITSEKLLRDPSTKDFFDIFQFLLAQIDPQYEVHGKLEDEVPSIMRRLKYPVEVNRSKLQAISGPNTWPQLLAVLDWLVVLVRINQDLVEPLAECQLSLTADERGDIGEHQLLRCMHENYIQYLQGQEDNPEEDRLKQIYEERISALRGEILRLQEQHSDMDKRLQDFRSEQEHLQTLKQVPQQLEVECDRLRQAITSSESHVQRMEDEVTALEKEDDDRRAELEQLQGQAKRLTEQVESQACTKRDLERLLCQRDQKRANIKDLRADEEKIDEEVWKLGMQESNYTEKINRLIRQINDGVESLDQALSEVDGRASSQDVLLRIDLNDPSDALASQDFTALRDRVQRCAASQVESMQNEEAAVQGWKDEQRIVQEELSEKQQEGRRQRVRLEQLTRTREDYRSWSAGQLDEAQRTAEATEDAVHTHSIGEQAPSMRDVAEVDKLQMKLNVLRTQGANEKAALQEKIAKGKERIEEHKQFVVREIESFAKSTIALIQEAEAAAEAITIPNPAGSPPPSARRSASRVTRGGA